MLYVGVCVGDCSSTWSLFLICIFCLLLCYTKHLYLSLCDVVVFFFFKQKTAYEMRISDWSSDVCSSDLHLRVEIVVCLHMHHDNAAIVIARFANIDHLATSGPKGDEVFVYARCAAHSE